MTEIQKIDAEYSYNSRLDVVRIEIKEQYKYKESIDLETGVYLDFDENYFPVNLEIIDASKRIGVNKEFLIAPSGNVKITITKETINVEVIFENDDQSGFLNLNTLGADYIPNIETTFALV